MATYVFLTKREALLKIGTTRRNLMLSSIAFVSSWGLLLQAMKLIPIADAVFLNCLSPVYVALMAPVFLNEKIERSTFLALALSLLGTVLITSPGFNIGMNSLGLTLGLLSGLGCAIWIIVSKKILPILSSQSVTLYNNIFGAIYFIPALVGIDLSVGANSWLLLIVLGVLNTAVATSLYLRGLDIVKAQKAVILNYLEPAVAVMFGYLFLSQRATPGMILGGSLILVAGYIVTTKRRGRAVTDSLSLTFSLLLGRSTDRSNVREASPPVGLDWR